MKILQESQQTTTKAQLVISDKLAQRFQQHTNFASPKVVQTDKPTTIVNIPVVTRRSIFSDGDASSDSDDENTKTDEDDDILRLACIQGRVPTTTIQQTTRRRYSDAARDGIQRRPLHHSQSGPSHTTATHTTTSLVPSTPREK